MLSSTTNLCN